MQAHVHTLAGPDHRTVADNRRANNVNTEAIDGQSALQGAHVARPLTVAEYPATDTTTTKRTPSPVAVYFGGVTRGPIGSLRKALLLSVPKWAVLSLSFIGNSALEIICDRQLVDRLATTMKALGFRHLTTFNPRKSLNPSSTQLKKHAACYRRWMSAQASIYSPAAKAWYRQEASKLASQHDFLHGDGDEELASTAPAQGNQDTTAQGQDPQASMAQDSDSQGQEAQDSETQDSELQDNQEAGTQEQDTASHPGGEQELG